MRQYNDIRFPKGFTLIELLVVVAVLGILAGGILIALNITGTIGKATLAKSKRFAAQLESGLSVNQVGKWSFEEPGPGTCSGGADACDTSGYRNNGTFVGGATTTPSCDNLSLGRCLILNGTSHYVEMNTRVLNSSGSFTISAWIKPTVAGGGGPFRSIVSEVSAVTTEAGQFNMRITDTANIQLMWREPINLLMVPLNSNTVIKAGQWYHIVGVNLVGALQLYINGIKDSAPQGAPTSWSSSGITLTRIGYDVNGYFWGLIDQVQIYNQPLTLSQVEKLYAQGLVSHLLAKW